MQQIIIDNQNHILPKIDLADFKNHLVRKRLKPQTIKVYLREVEGFLEFIHIRGREVRDVDTIMIATYTRYMEHSGVKGSTIARNITSVSAYFSYLLENGKIGENPLENYNRPALKKKRRQLLSSAELNSILLVAGENNPRDAVVILLLNKTELGIDEILGLKTANLNMDMRYLKTGRGIVGIDDEIYHALRTYVPKRKKKESAFLFQNYRGGQMRRQGFWKNLKAYVAQAGIERPVNTTLIKDSRREF